MQQAWWLGTQRLLLVAVRTARAASRSASHKQLRSSYHGNACNSPSSLHGRLGAPANKPQHVLTIHATRVCSVAWFCKHLLGCLTKATQATTCLAATGRRAALYTEAGARRASACAPPSSSLFHLPAWLSHSPRKRLTVCLLVYLCSALIVSTARAPVAYAQVQKMELRYQCGDVVAPALLGDAVTHTLTELGYAIVRPIVVSESGETALLNVHCAVHTMCDHKQSPP